MNQTKPTPAEKNRSSGRSFSKTSGGFISNKRRRDTLVRNSDGPQLSVSVDLKLCMMLRTWWCWCEHRRWIYRLAHRLSEGGADHVEARDGHLENFLFAGCQRNRQSGWFKRKGPLPPGDSRRNYSSVSNSGVTWCDQRGTCSEIKFKKNK